MGPVEHTINTMEIQPTAILCSKVMKNKRQCFETEDKDLENPFSLSMETNSDATTIEDVSNVVVVSGEQGAPIDVALQVKHFHTQRTRQNNYI